MKDKEKQYKKEIEAMQYFANKNAVSILDVVNNCSCEDNEKQIEELAKLMCGNDCEECARESAEFYKQTIEEARNINCLLKNCANKLYEQGYRKIPENSVVLTKEEYDEIKVYQSYVPEMKKAFDKVSKATAEKIFEKGEEFYKMSYHKSNAMPRLVEWIKDTFGVEIKE